MSIFLVSQKKTIFGLSIRYNTMKTLQETDSEYICDIKAPCFQQLSGEEARLLQQNRTQVLFRKGDTLTKQGTYSSYILFLMNGVVKQYLEGNDNKTFNLSIQLPGEFIGLSSLFSSETVSYSTACLTDCQAVLVTKESLSRVLHANADFTLKLAERHTKQESELYEALRNQQFKQMNGRLAAALLYLNGIKELQPALFTLLSRKDLADFAGLSTESTVKLLKAFEKDGLIELQDKNIRIRNLETLKTVYIRG